MATRTQPGVLAITLLLSGVPTGCTLYSEYAKCGLRGCAGDAQITSAVRARLYQDAALRAPNLVYVQTLDGVVFLSGEVATELQRDTAVSAAHEIASVRAVVDTIGLEYSGR